MKILGIETSCDETAAAVIEDEEGSLGVALGYNDANEVVGIEMLYLSRCSSNLSLSLLEFETV